MRRHLAGTAGSGCGGSLRQAGKRWRGLSAIAARAPYLSSLLILAVGIYTCLHGWQGIGGGA